LLFFRHDPTIAAISSNFGADLGPTWTGLMD
jgi:hypothetical protein